MTLVYRSQKSSSLINSNSNIGPGTYNIQKSNNNKDKNKKKNNSSSIFLSTTKRDAFQVQKYQKQIRQKQKAQLKLKQQIQNNQYDNQIKLQTNILNKNNQIYQQQEQQYSEGTQQNDNNQNVINIIKPKRSNDCKHIFNSKVQRFNLQSLSNSIYNQLRLTQQKSKQKYLAQQFNKLLVKKQSSHDKISKQLNLKELNSRKRPSNEIVQKFPSIPTWQNSYGYRKDPQTNLLIANQNPNKIFKIESELQNEQMHINKCFGPGYYVFKNKQEKKRIQLFKKSLKKAQQKQNKQLLNHICYPKNKYQAPIYNSIEEKQNKIKLRIKTIGKNHINKIQEYQKQNESPIKKKYQIKIKVKQNQTIDKKTILINHRMLQQYKQYLPQEAQKQPIKFFKNLSNIKNSNICQNKSQGLNRHSQHNQSSLNFLSKSSRFQSLNISFMNQKNQQNPRDSSISEDRTIQNSNLLLKSFNKKQPYTLGQQRFKQKNYHQKIGPGAYNHQLHQSRSTSPFLKLNQARFFNLNSKIQMPGPGQYNVIQQIQKNPNHLSLMYAEYKKTNNQLIKKNFQKQNSMQTLYQTWGKQVNFREKQQRLKQNQQQNKQKKSNHFNNKQNKQINQKSFNKVRLQISSQINRLGIHNENIRNSLNFKNNQEGRSQKISSLHPKIIKHLYEYNQKDKNLPQIGPGSYQIRHQMVKKTHNVTYT